MEIQFKPKLSTAYKSSNGMKLLRQIEMVLAGTSEQFHTHLTLRPTEVHKVEFSLLNCLSIKWQKSPFHMNVTYFITKFQLLLLLWCYQNRKTRCNGNA
jgi:hypothetical protein